MTSTDQASAAGRTARRARAPVNYAEPNLISKMRRPTKELVDAVVPDGRRSTSAKPDEASAPPTTVEKEKAKLCTGIVKRGGDEDDGLARKSLPSAADGSAGAADDVGEPNSPLSKKTARQNQSQGQGQAQDEAPAGPPTLNSSAAANAISALISASATSRRRPVAQASNPEPEKRPVPPDPLGERKEKEKENHLAVFHFTDSSPLDTASGRPRVDLAKQAQAGRRHSSVPASAVGALPAVSAKRGAGVRSVSAAGVAASREREREREREKGSREMRQAKSSAPLRSSSSSCSSSSSTVNSGAGDESGGEKGSGRGERAAARRRSMML